MRGLLIVLWCCVGCIAHSILISVWYHDQEKTTGLCILLLLLIGLCGYLEDVIA